MVPLWVFDCFSVASLYVFFFFLNEVCMAFVPFLVILVSLYLSFLYFTMRFVIDEKKKKKNNDNHDDIDEGAWAFSLNACFHEWGPPRHMITKGGIMTKCSLDIHQENINNQAI